MLEVEEIEKSSEGSVKDMNQNDTFLDPTELSQISIADLLKLVKWYAEINTIYNVGKIKEEGEYSLSGSKPVTDRSDTVRSPSSNNSIPQNSEMSTENAKKSLSVEDEHPIRRGNFHISGDDVRFEAPLREDIAPTRETVDETENIAPITADKDLSSLELEHKITRQKYLDANRSNDAEAIRRYSAKLVEIEQRIAQAKAQDNVAPEDIAPMK